MNLPFALPTRFLVAQLVLLVAGVTLVLTGNKSAPRLELASTQLGANQPILITTSRPLDHARFEENFSLQQNGEAVPGTFQWSTRYVAFVPDQPLLHGATYEVRIAEDAADRLGTPLRRDVQTTVTVNPARFLYLSPSHQLARYTVSTGSAEVLSESGEEVVTYAVAPDGSWLVYSFRMPQTNRFGLVKLSGADFQKRTIITGGDRAFYDRVAICGPLSELIAMKRELNRDGTIAASSLVQFIGETPTLLVSADQLGTPEVLECAETSDQFVYRDHEGSLQISRIGRSSETASLGVYDHVYGFSPLGGQLLVGLTTNAGYPTLRTLYQIDENGIRTLLSDERYDAADPELDPTEQYLARSEDRRSITAEDFLTRSQIVVRTAEPGSSEQVVVTEPGVTYSDQNPSWSRDSRYLSIERVPLANSANRPQDAQGQPLDAEIWIFEIPRGQSLLQIPSTPRSLKLWGGSVAWLP